ncbi:LytTR family DNA-binding domain-containing protein [Paenibacillus sp. MMS20-IR301]|uniref:LytR/AlgR family response regulator transcription factor n=1 Tax=Paenibacillus sp. MMS20-IR301 TaxID=2895946 RepID=UPI0028E35938|nr:LytTR family DNA-binding domain-containing protein [Paenibacillus sp. MMS20-IR301]WNS47100.1 LytTR family DNA-binding domain-containing protein [Paenibacillus sp. MMS20-IR301]
MNICILEDDIVQQKRLEKIVVTLLEKHGISCNHLFTTSRADNLLLEIDTNCSSIYFLDIQIKKMNYRGLEIAKEIRDRDPYGSIVFVTTHSEYAPLTYSYKVSALDFIDKTQAELDFAKQIEECLLIANQEKCKLNLPDYFIFDNNYSKFKVPLYEILYFECMEIPHKLRLVTKTKVMEFYGELCDISLHNNQFFRCHRSYIVNIANIVSVHKREKKIILKDEKQCYVSRRLLKDLIQRIEEERIFCNYI